MGVGSDLTPDVSSPTSWDELSESEGKQALIFFGNDVPHDDIGTLFRALQRSSKDLRCSQLAAFISLCNHNIKTEIAKLPRNLQREVPPFETVLALVDDAAFRKGPLGGALEGVFLCIYQIGMLISYHEVEKKHYDFAEAGVTLAGLGCGLLAAAATSVSRTLTDLATSGAQVVQLAFRLGVHVYERSDQLEAPLAEEKDPEPWAYVIPGLAAVDVQRELDIHNEQKGNSSLTKIFISAADKTSVSVSGPPSRLKAALKSSDLLRYSNFFQLPVHHGLCHAPHIYSKADVEAISRDVLAEHDVSEKLLVPLLSSDTGTALIAGSFGVLLEKVTAELLTSQIHIDNIAQGIHAKFKSDLQADSSLFTFRTSLVLKAIMSTVEADEDAPKFTWTDLTKWTAHEEPARIPRTPKQSKLAVVGMSCRLPGGANDLELYWKLMSEGRDVHTTIPPDRFDLDTHYDPTGQTENATQTPFMNPMDNPGLFDAGFFNMSPREAEQTDPMHRLALVTAYEALEMAGHAPNRTPSTSSTRVGSYYGQASDDWRELNGSQNIGTYAVPAGERGFANGRIQYFFKFSGPCFNMDTACSSGLAAVNAACSAVWSGECDTALAGGLNVITDPDNFCQLGKGHFLSMTGQCKVWDEAADGYCRADGVGSVVIKRLEDAEADNDNILACILSASTNQSAEAISITHPHAPTQIKNYSQVMSSAGISPLDVSYLELHGTGTQAGDREESRSVAEVFAPLNPRRRKNQRLRLGAVKSNIGHGEAAAGIASFIKVLLMYQKGSVPPQVGVKKLNPTLPTDLEERNMGLNFEISSWPKPEKGTRHAVVNSFGAHGGNTTVLLEDPPERPRVAQDPRTTYPMTVSARSRNSLKMNLEALIAYIQDSPEVSLGDLAYTLCARRMHHPFRVGENVRDHDQLRKVLNKQLEFAQDVQAVPVKPPEVIFTFTGQGVFYNGVGSQLYQQFPLFRTEVDRLNRLVESLELPSVVPCIQRTAGDDYSPIQSQVTIVVLEMALTKLWKAFGIVPSAVLGHSLGEYPALTAAGVLSELDALYLVGARAKLLMKSCDTSSHKMLSVRASLSELEKLLETKVDWELSCVNGENDTVISGTAKAMEDISSILQDAKVKCSLLKVPFAFHTAQMDPILDSIENMAQDITFREPKIPVISPLLAECVFDGKTLSPRYLRRATREPVDFVGAIDAAQQLGIADPSTVWVDIGPHFVSGVFVRNISGSSKVIPTLKKDEDNFVTLSSSMSALHLEGLPVSWNEFFRPYEKAHKLLHLPAYRWNAKNYWIPYVGTWTLDKAHIKDNLPQQADQLSGTYLSSKLKTSLIHGIAHESVEEARATLTTISNILDPSFIEAVMGHEMNGHGVATSSIWADMAWTVGRYLYQQAFPKASEPYMNVADMDILHAQIAKGKSGSQLLQLEATLDFDARAMSIYLYNAFEDGTRSLEHFGSCSVLFQDGNSWRREWDRTGHLVTERAHTLVSLAREGKANKLTRNMAYTLFKNVVDYADRYRGMQSVSMKGYEACAEVTLSREEHGIWNTPPHWIDSVVHLAGLIMNGSDASNTKDYFWVTPGWESMRFIKPLEPGGCYMSYVKMSPADEENMFAGDVYIMQDEEIVGMVDQIRFRRVPRVLMNKFFSPPTQEQTTDRVPSAPQPASSSSAAESTAVKASITDSWPASKDTEDEPVPQAADQQSAAAEKAPENLEGKVTEHPTASSKNPAIDGAIDLIASETGLERSELKDETTFSQIGVDSLMSLVLAEKFKGQLKLGVESSLFLECSTIGELTEWLEENR